MEEVWKEYKLGDVLCQKGYIRGPFGSALKRGDLLKEGIPVYEQQHAIYNRREFRYYISEEKYNEMKRFSVCPEDIIISCSGTVGEVSLIKKEDPLGIISQALLLLRVDTKKILPEFLLYFFKTSKGHNSIISRSSGSVQVNIARREVVESIPLLLPCICIQKSIVTVLRTIDNKIECNRRINDNLQHQANALFKSWFVDFEPFIDDEFAETEMGMIPKGWQAVSLISIAKYLNGLAMQNFRPEGNDKGLPVLKIKELGQGMSDSSSDKCSSDIDKLYIVNDGDVIFSWSGTLLVDLWCGGQCGLNQHLFKVSSKDYPKWFYYMWTKQHLNNFIQIAKDKAVTMGHIKRGHLEEAKVLVPTKSAMNTMTAIMQPIIDEIIDSRIESRRLSQLRDALLPRLMSGELKVNEIEMP